MGVTPPSTWPWLDHPVSGLIRVTRVLRPFRTRFRCAFAYRLKLATQTNSLTHYTRGTPSPHHGAPTACRHPVSGSLSLPSSGCFSPFPHGTGALSVTEEYLGLEGGPPVFGQDCTCPALLKDPSAAFPYGAVTRSGPPFQTVPVTSAEAAGLVRVRSPLLAESRLMSFPPATEMFQFAGFASRAYGFSAGSRSRGGLPHSEIPGSQSARLSPGLFAACHVLRRLSVPRHPPDALQTLHSFVHPHARDDDEPGGRPPDPSRSLCPSRPGASPVSRATRLYSLSRPLHLGATTREDTLTAMRRRPA